MCYPKEIGANANRTLKSSPGNDINYFPLGKKGKTIMFDNNRGGGNDDWGSQLACFLLVSWLFSQPGWMPVDNLAGTIFKILNVAKLEYIVTIKTFFFTQ